MIAAIETREPRELRKLYAVWADILALRDRIDRAERDLQVLKQAAKVKEAGQ